MSDSSANTVKASGDIKTESEEPQDNSENQLPRRSDRLSIPTDKMAHYKAEEIEKREKNFSRHSTSGDQRYEKLEIP